MTPLEFRTIRKQLGMTQRELADALGFKQKVSISRRERGVTPISTPEALAVQGLARGG